MLVFPDILPTASTCSLEFRLPTVHGDFSSFKEAMITDMKAWKGVAFVSSNVYVVITLSLHCILLVRVH